VIAFLISLQWLHGQSGATLVWSDEFEGMGIPDTSKWDQPEYNRRNNDEGPDGWWSKEDSFLDGEGNLVIRVRKIDNKNSDNDPYDYSVGAIHSIHKFEQTYGKFEMRARLPTQPGWWVAFWMMQGEVGSIANGGVDGSEVDIMEGFGWNNVINQAIHWDGYGEEHEAAVQKTTLEGLHEEFHVYTLEWHPDKYVFFIDGKETWQSEGGGVCNLPGYVIVSGELSTESWATSLRWAFDPRLASYPDSFIVDYVRVYQFALSPSIDLVEFPGDTLIMGEDNSIVLDISDADGTVDSVHVAINAYEFVYENTSGRFEFELDTLPAGDYQMVVEAFDNDYNSASDTLTFVIVLAPNKLPVLTILSPIDQSVLYFSAGNSLTADISDEDGTIESTELFVDGESIPGMELGPGRFDIDFLTQGVHTLSIEAKDDRDGIAIDSVEVIVADSLVTIDHWTLYHRNGALASFFIHEDTLKIDVERASGLISDIQLMIDMEYVAFKSESNYVVTFKAYSDKYTYLTLALKGEPFLDDTLLSLTFYLTPGIDSFALSDIPETDSHNVLTFFLGYRQDVSVYISDFQMEILSSYKPGMLDRTGTIYPNPVSEILYFSMETDYWIYSLSGSLQLEGKRATKSDLSALPKGLYVVKTNYGTFKFTKE
jgi:hypothetical protein